jgi:hypothetical protein
MHIPKNPTTHPPAGGCHPLRLLLLLLLLLLRLLLLLLLLLLLPPLLRLCPCPVMQVARAARGRAGCLVSRAGAGFKHEQGARPGGRTACMPCHLLGG